MKNVFFVTMFLFGFLSLSAHPADEISANYIHSEQLLEIEIMHNVRDADKHFIKEIKIVWNDEEIIVQKFQEQNTKEKLVICYKINSIQPGDILKISARCNKFGTKKLDFTIPEKD